MNLKTIFMWLIVAITPLYTQTQEEEIIISHEALYFKPYLDVVAILGEPHMEQQLADSMWALKYPLANRAEIMWVIFGYFNNWYQMDQGWGSVFPQDKPIVVNISYYPVLP